MEAKTQKHTSGQWTIDGDDILANGWEFICSGYFKMPENKANARLIAAAPDMFDTLKVLQLFLEGNHAKSFTKENALTLIRHTIKQAEGGK